MKKRLIAVILSVLLALGMTACTGDVSYSDLSVTGIPQDTTFVVRSNGGNAVQYGNYVYFINGTRGYEDTDGKSNVWGRVDKGALYRAELAGTTRPSKDYPGFYDFEPDLHRDQVTDEPVSGLEFIADDGLDYDDNKIYVPRVQQIASKTIGTSGYADGGIFIYDNYVYYATPNNEKSKTGTVQTTKTDFFRTRLDGKNTTKLYTSKADTATAPYAFYKQNGSVYLVVYENPNIISVKIGDKKVLSTTIIADDATSVYFPQRDAYYTDMPTNDPEDFIYMVRSVAEGDSQRSGTVIEVMRPSGEERFIFSMPGNNITETIEAVRDGLLFYRTKEGTRDVIKYTNLHDQFMTADEDGNFVSKSYAEFQAKAVADPSMAKYVKDNIAGIAVNTSNLSSYTYTYAFRPNLYSNQTYVLCGDANGLYLFTGSNSVAVYSGAATVKAVYDNPAGPRYAYFTESDGTIYYRTDIMTPYEDKSDDEKKQQLTDETVSSGLKVDLCAGYLVYFAKVDQWADGYAFFKKIDGIQGMETQFVGIRTKDDIRPDDWDENDENSGTEDGSGESST